jgi:hypothetical protein
LLDVAESRSSEGPFREGDITVCLYCSHVMEWTGEKFSELSDEAIEDIAGDPEMLEVIKLTEAYRRWNKERLSKT